MKFAADYRREAREALRGKWPLAILASLLATVLGGISGASTSTLTERFKDHMGNSFIYETLPLIIMLFLVLVVYSGILMIIGGAVRLGYCQFNLDLIDGHYGQIDTVTSHLDRKWHGFLLSFLTNLYTILWALLFIIPGIMKSYSYALAPYILAENRGMTPNEAITESKRLMRGNRFRLFCLHFSFIGWALLAALPGSAAAFILGYTAGEGSLGVRILLFILSQILASVGMVMLSPYTQAAEAAFYRDLSPKPEPIQVYEYYE